MKSLTHLRYASCLALTLFFVIFVGTVTAQPVLQPVPQPMPQPTAQSMPQPMPQSTPQPMAQPTPQSAQQPMARPTSQAMPLSSDMVNPPRWTEPDVTAAQRLSTATKEAVNARQQFLDECKSASAAQYAPCATAVNQTYEQEMADIRRRFPQ